MTIIVTEISPIISYGNKSYYKARLVKVIVDIALIDTIFSDYISNKVDLRLIPY